MLYCIAMKSASRCPDTGVMRERENGVYPYLGQHTIAVSPGSKTCMSLFIGGLNKLVRSRDAAVGMNAPLKLRLLLLFLIAVPTVVQEAGHAIPGE